MNSLKNPFFIVFYHGITITVLISLCVFAVGQYWGAVGTTLLLLALIFLPIILVERYGFYIPFALRFCISLFSFETLFLGHMQDFYDLIPHWDKFVHFQSGILFAICGFILIHSFSYSKKIAVSPFLITLFIVTFALSVGVVWEVCEFVGDAYFGSQWQYNNADTMWDLIADGAGGVVAGIIGYIWMIRYRLLPFSKWKIKFAPKKHEDANI